MEQLKEIKDLNPAARKAALLFIGTAVFCLLMAALAGLLAAIQFNYPSFLRSFPFHKMRPIHVGLALGWIFFGAIGGVYYYLETQKKSSLWSPKLALAHYYIFLLTGLSILGSYAAGIFGGREYLEYPPFLSPFILLGWLLFTINVLKSLPDKFKRLPSFLWMWCTGAILFIFSFSEAYAWLIPYFSSNVVRDVTVQWKSYGALSASWNLLIYGTAICLMSRIHKDENLLYGKRSFFLYFVGITNSFFNWAHHTYTVPAKPWVAYIAYGVSMTEWIVLYYVIRGWLKSYREKPKEDHQISCSFLYAADVWVILNLILALLISIPAINFLTHGTHITVAHSMGSTIGINTMILLASVFYVVTQLTNRDSKEGVRLASFGLKLANVSFFIFWISLIGAGIARGALTAENKIENFAEVQQAVSPYINILILAGAGLLAGLILVVSTLLPKRKGV